MVFLWLLLGSWIVTTLDLGELCRAGGLGAGVLGAGRGCGGGERDEEEEEEEEGVLRLAGRRGGVVCLAGGVLAILL